MRIGNSSLDSLIGSGPGAVNGTGNESPAVSRTSDGTGADSVRLSSASSLVGRAKASDAATDPAKLASLAAQLRSGQYQADTAQVSHAVVDGHLQL
jgi:anti-sigma28 factor (negative regulator of flagellin synthesis)